MTDNHSDHQHESVFERELRDRLRSLADHAPTKPTSSGSARDAAVRRPGLGGGLSDRRWMMAAAAVTIVLVGAVLLGNAIGRENQSAIVAVDGPVPPTDGGRWETMSDAPITFDERAYAAAVWTGDNVLFWAGANLARSVAYADGATYDPATDTWGSIPVPGWGHPGLSSAYLNGGLYATAKGSVVKLDFDAARWEDLATTDQLEMAAVVAVDDVLYGVGPRGFDGDDSADLGIARYNAEADSWDPPVFVSDNGLSTVTSAANTFSLLVDRPPLWTGSEIVVWYPTQVGGLAFDLDSRSWRQLPESTPADWPSSGPPDLTRSLAAVVGGSLVVVASDAQGRGAVIGRLTEDEWRWDDDVLPMTVDDQVTVIAAGDWILLISPEDATISYHVSSGRWFVDSGGPQVTAPNTVWTGSELVVWGGGGSPTTEGRTTNMMWRPPPSLTAGE